MVDVRLILFGSPRIERDRHFLEMDTRKAVALFAFLALAEVEQQRDKLVTLLYPESDPASARAAFRRTLSTLNSALGQGVLSIRRDVVGIAPSANLWVDVLEFQACLKQPDDLNSLIKATQLYRDDFMAGFSLRDSPIFDDWQYHQAETMRRQLDRVLDQVSARLAYRGDVSGALLAAERRVRLDPLVEEAQRRLMELYARSGQRGAALRQYRECVRILEQELGVAPLEITTHLYQEILSGKLLEETASLPGKDVPAPSQPVQSVYQEPPLIGREKELTGLEKVLEQTSSAGFFIAIEGEAGVGKTRLAEEFLDRARQAGRLIAHASCYEGQLGLAYAPFLEAIKPLLEDQALSSRLTVLPALVLSEVSHLFPQFVKEPVSPLFAETPGTRARFFEALHRMVNCLLGGDKPGILFLDDLHWADSSTLDLVSYLARRMKHSGWVLLATWRQEHNPVNDRLNQLLSELKRSGIAQQIILDRMSPNDINVLARSINPTLPHKVADRLFQESEGLPFIALEYLHSIDPSKTDWTIPGGVRALLHRRLQEPGETARQLLSAAAVIGRSFNFNLLQSISGRSEWETVSALEELIRLGLVHERSGSEYDFNHEKLRALAYDETSQARRRLLHLRVAESLVAEGANIRDSGTWAGLAANHFLLASQPQRASEYFRQAGEHFRRLHANQQALEAFQSALTAGHPDSARLHEACGDLYKLSGEYGAAINSYQSAAAFCAPSCLSELMHKLGEVYQRRGEWEVAEAHYKTALESASDDDSTDWQAHLFADWSLTVYRANRPERAQELAEKSLFFAQQGKDSTALAQALNMLGILARARGDLLQASEFFNQSLKVAKDLGKPNLHCAVLHNLARLEHEHGHPEKAVSMVRQALEYCKLIGDRHHQAALLNTLADLQHDLGNESESMTYLKQAVALFAEIQEDVGWEQPEIWKLTEW